MAISQCPSTDTQTRRPAGRRGGAQRLVLWRRLGVVLLFLQYRQIDGFELGFLTRTELIAQPGDFPGTAKADAIRLVFGSHTSRLVPVALNRGGV